MTGALQEKLKGVVGAPNVLLGVECSPYVLEGRAPEAVVFPGTREEVAAVLVLASEEGVPVAPWGGGTRLTMGSPPSRLGMVLGTKRLNRVLEHEPGDLTVTVEAGVPLGALQAQLGQRGQWLSLDPPDADRASVGGVIASNASGPRRHLYGTCRDLLIGLVVVHSDGSIVRGGGKVVKNVAGYDLPKLYVGSYGTLGVVVEATLRLRPRSEVDRVVVARFARMKEAGAAARAIMASDLVPSALELVDADALRALGQGEAGAAALVGLDGIGEQVDWQCAEVSRVLTPLGLQQARVLDGGARDDLWRGLARLGRGGTPGVAAVMSWGVLPTQLADLMESGGALAVQNGVRATISAHAGLGLATASVVIPTPAIGADRALLEGVVSTLTGWRALIGSAGGHALVEWAPLAVKEWVSVWEAPGPTARLMKALKDRLDPKNIMNPGRFVGGL